MSMYFLLAKLPTLEPESHGKPQKIFAAAKLFIFFPQKKKKLSSKGLKLPRQPGNNDFRFLNVSKYERGTCVVPAPSAHAPPSNAEASLEHNV